MRGFHLCVCCSVLQCVAVGCSVLRLVQCVAVCCSRLQCVAVFCSVLQLVAVCCSRLRCVAVGCSVLQLMGVGLCTVPFLSLSRMQILKRLHYYCT